ncbi:hypothetical protein AA103196_2560 [Ameyamaea chiangmaiensis NBRC 103196]|uniref:Uncharacterized protein n=1 Tax=Ameyamaea chiangmaiensis TaxID=442969 RepID=A0A850PHU8_9PROT|nr:hypothetical protein [Ameyamaea chiangmaiensis]MBS4075638.1 hypothetical protein [Ameyamaea chiangmaiensis]NVN41980.1 hypothetical protein [Ameyamaea chiangmaiensis]GBQ70678.1 hypothetical protein AA103196_2560 [Ameyamaea chiangmaiensis NBRC 103196]
MSLRPTPPTLPRLPQPRRLKIAVLAGLVLVYGAVTLVLTHHPKRPPMEIVTIPVDVVKAARRVPPAPPAVVALQPVPTVTLPPPTLVLRGR